MMNTLVVLSAMLLLVPTTAYGINHHGVGLRFSLTGSDLLLSEEPANSRYGSMVLGGLRLAFDTHHSVQPFLTVDYGRAYAQYPYRVTTKRLGAGLQVGLIKQSRFRAYVGGSLLVTRSSERLTYSPCLPGHDVTGDYGYTSATCQLLGGSEWFLVPRRVSFGIEFAFAPTGDRMRTSTADPPSLNLSGYLVGGYLTVDLCR